jgi:hypothetical protein
MRFNSSKTCTVVVEPPGLIGLEMEIAQQLFDLLRHGTVAPRPLEEDQPRVAQCQRNGLDALLDAADRGAVGRGVVLHLLRGLDVVVAAGRRRLALEKRRGRQNPRPLD